MTSAHCLSLVVGLLLASAVVPPAAGQEPAGGIAVQIVDADTRRPVEGVVVSARSRDGEARELSTSADGTATFRSLPAGLYAVAARADDYVVGQEPSVRVVARRATPLFMELRRADAALDEIVVFARAIEADDRGAVSASYRNREELRSAVGTGSDVMRALDGLPGLVSTGDFANFSVRGRGPRDNLVFVDGFPLDKVVHFDQSLGEEEDIGGGGRFSIFAPNSIAGAEFSPGGWSAAYAGRSGSLLQLDVAGGGPTPSASLRIDVAGAEFMYEGPSGVRDDTTMFFTARQFDFGRLFEQIDQQDIGQPELTDVIVKTVTDLDLDNTIELLGVYAPEQYTRDIDNVLASPNFEDVSLIDAEQDLGLIGVTWRRLVGDTGEWINRLYLRRSDKLSSEGEAYPDRVPAGTPAGDVPVRERLLTIREDERELGWRSDFGTRNRYGALSAGLRVVRYDLSFDVALREDWTRYVYESGDPRPAGEDYIVLMPANVDSSYDAAATSYAVYGEQVFEFDRWDLRAGLRYDHDGLAGESLVSPRLAANFRPTASLRIAATAGVYYQSPRFLVRAANPDNADIENERVSHFSVGFTRTLGRDWSLLVEPYYQRLDNLVVADGRTDGRVTNAGTGQAHGVDVVLSRSFSDGWFADVTWSWNRVRIDDNDGSGVYDADFSRPAFFSVGGSWEINERWKIGARWKYASGRPTDDFVINEDVLGPGEPLRYSKELTRQNALRLDDYHSLNIRIDYRRPLGPVNLVAFLDVINVYGGPGGGTAEFDPRRGVNVDDDGDAFPIIGLIFERTW